MSVCLSVTDSGTAVGSVPVDEDLPTDTELSVCLSVSLCTYAVDDTVSSLNYHIQLR